MTARSVICRLRNLLDVPNHQALAATLMVDPALISKAYNGHSKVFTLPILHRMAVTSGVPIGQLAEWWVEGQPQPDGI